MIVGAVLAAILGSVLFAALRMALPADAESTGDVDCSGAVTSIDAALILQYTAGRISTLQCTVGDVNNDGSTNSIDSLFILQLVAGLIPSFPSCDVTAAPPSAQDEIDVATSGTTICLQNGTYDRLFVYQKSGITITGLGPDRTVVVDNPDHHTCLLVLQSQDIRVEGMRAQDCTVQAAFAGDRTNVDFSHVDAAGGPIGFQFQRSTGHIEHSTAHDHHDFGAIVQMNTDVTIDHSSFANNGFGIISQENTQLHLIGSSVTNNSQGGVYTLHQTGSTSIDGSTILNNALNVFAGVPGCADLPAGDPNPPQCFLDNPSAYVSQITLEISDSTIGSSRRYRLGALPWRPSDDAAQLDLRQPAHRLVRLGRAQRDRLGQRLRIER